MAQVPNRPGTARTSGPVSGGETMSPAPPRRPYSGGPGGQRRWNTPKELQRLLTSISTSPKSMRSPNAGQVELPPLVPQPGQPPAGRPKPHLEPMKVQGDEKLSSQSERPSDAHHTPPPGQPLAFDKGMIPSQLVSPVTTERDTSVFRGTRPSPTPLREDAAGYPDARARRRGSSMGSGGPGLHNTLSSVRMSNFRRLSSQSGHSSMVRLLMPGEQEPRDVGIRVTPREVVISQGAEGEIRPKILLRISLLDIIDVEERCGKLIMQLQREGDEAMMSSPSANRGSGPGPGGPLSPRQEYDRYEIMLPSSSVDDDDTVLELLMFSIVRAQVRALQGETTKLRKSLRPVGARVLDVVHFNDVYHNEIFKTEEPCGGASRFFHTLCQIRETRNPLVLFSGDFVGPSLMSVLTRGKQMVDALNFVGTHYGCFGNHEFDFGLRNLERIIHGYTHGEYIFAGSQTEWVMSNMEGADGKPLGGVTKMKLIEWNGVKVGILGLCENWLRNCPRLGKEEARYLDLCETGESLAQELKRQGAEVVIALTHNRLDVDKEVTAACPSIDILLGGHDHFYKSSLQNRVLKSGEEYQWLSEIQIVVDEEGKSSIGNSKAHAIKSETPEHPRMNALVQRYEQKMAEKMGKVIGRCEFALDSTEECCRWMEGHLSNFVADIMQEGGDDEDWQCDCAILGGAAVSGKALKPPGVITIGDVFNWFPHETKVQRVKMTGDILRRLLRVSVRELPEEAPSFPHPSESLHFTINGITGGHKPPTVTDIFIKGEPLDPHKDYVVAVTDFVAAGKERFKFLTGDGVEVLTDSEHAEQLSVWMLEFFKQKKGQRAEAGEEDKEDELPTAGSVQLQPSEGTDAGLSKERSTTLEKAPEGAAGKEGNVVVHGSPNKSRQSLFSSGVFAGDEIDLDDIETLDMDVPTMKKLMMAFAHLSEEIELFSAQEFIKDAVKDLLMCDRATIFIADHVNKTLKFVPDGSDQEISIPINMGIAGLCATEGKIVNIPDAYKDSRFNQKVDQKTKYRTRNILACPVKRKGCSNVYGVIQAINKDVELGPFSDRDEKVLMLFGSQAGQHLSHSEIFETMEANQEATHLLLRIARELMQDVTLDLKSMVNVIMSSSSQLFRCDRSSLFLVDNKAPSGRPEMWTIIRDPNSGRETVIRLEIGKGIAGHVAATGQTIRLKKAHDSPLFNTKNDKETGYHTEQVLCVPIYPTEGSTDVLGVIQFINKLNGVEFTDGDEKLAQAFAAFAGLSISNSQEVDLLKLQHDETLLQEVPFKPLGRIKQKGGWSTVRRAVRTGVFRMLSADGLKVKVDPEDAAAKLGEYPKVSSRDNSPVGDSEIRDEIDSFRELRKRESNLMNNKPSWLQQGLNKAKRSGSRRQLSTGRIMWFGNRKVSESALGTQGPGSGLAGIPHRPGSVNSSGSSAGGGQHTGATEARSPEYMPVSPRGASSFRAGDSRSRRKDGSFSVLGRKDSQGNPAQPEAPYAFLGNGTRRGSPLGEQTQQPAGRRLTAKGVTPIDVDRRRRSSTSQATLVSPRGREGVNVRSSLGAFDPLISPRHLQTVAHTHRLQSRDSTSAGSTDS
eukprot:Hpha_TRINITY_DN11813_c0_g1::TRINITY_DN11813_c0_g1_i2::g.2166::m.2166